MKKDNIFNDPILLSQLEIAMLLGITRTQWAMYVTGQRGLPAQSRVKLGVLLSRANAVAKKEKLVQVKAQEHKRQQVIDSLLQENAFKQLQVQRKLVKMEAQFKAALNTLHFVAGFQNEAENESVLKLLEIKANKVLDKNGLHLQEVHKIQLEVLQQEVVLLLKRKKAMVT